MRLSKKHTAQMDAVMPKDMEPIIVPFYQQEAVLSEWEQKLTGAGFKIRSGTTSFGMDEEDSYDYRSTTKYHYLSVEIKNPYRKSWRDDFSPELRFNKNNELVIYHHALHKHWHLREQTQLEAYIEVVHAFFEEAYQKKQKKAKIRSLKQHSILAKIKTIAQEDGFEYQYESNTKWVTLHIKLSEQEALSIRIPFHNFQEVLLKVRPVILTVIKQHNTGVKFKIGKYTSSYWQS